MLKPTEYLLLHSFVSFNAVVAPSSLLHAQTPPTSFLFSKTVTSKPKSLNSFNATMPAGPFLTLVKQFRPEACVLPAPTIATLVPL